eukprot:TRINITY_DN8581_c0_g1_i1.p1 TRINITY_DN8581_c0_g1~~TRINITY_DN8581_c0_g1_i1.p1  ORF type:complete len:386 (-),score=45.23 TRINITY_DN8581_c0_g1_i1:52-1209(-)
MKEFNLSQKDFGKNTTQFERMVNKFREQCNNILFHDEKAFTKETKEISLKPEKLEKGQDQPAQKLAITYEEAKAFHTNLSLFHIIRKKILFKNNKLFSKALERLKEETSKLKSGDNGFISTTYDCQTQDLALLFCVSEHGLHCISQLKASEPYGFKNSEITQDMILNRLLYLRDFFKKFEEKISLKKKRIDHQPSYKEAQLKKRKFSLKRDDTNKVILPQQVNNSLTLLNIGKICTLPAYHSEHNLFPIGFKTIRMHPSMFTRGVRCEYTCEILEGQDNKPMYRVTSQEDPEHPIIRESSSGCWHYISSRVNELQDVKKEKVTISGTERFGLLESNVVKLLESLPEAQLCNKYNFKYKGVSLTNCLLYTSPSPRDRQKSRMPSSA